MCRPYALLMVTCLALLTACSDGPVRREMPLAFHDALPSALAPVTGDALHLDVENMEPLTDAFVLVVWAHKNDDTWVKIGTAMPGMDMAYAATPLGFAWGEVSEIVITDEPAPDTSTVPGELIEFQGPPGVALPLGGPDGATLEALQEATASVEIVDRDVAVHYDEFPELGAGRFYGVWLLPGGTSEAASMPGMDMGGGSSTAGHMEGPTEPAWVGRLDMSGHQEFSTEVDVATYHEVAITVELEHGVATPATMSIVMRGAIPTAAAQAGAAAPAHATHEH